MPKKKRPFQRDETTVRDASLIVIASEDTYAPKQYFARFATRRLQFLVLETTDGQSSPLALVNRLDERRQTTEFDEGDQFWLCLDQDHWAQSDHIQQITQAMRLCQTKGYGFAISNPCFELWILLHFYDKELPADISSDGVRALLIECHGGYNKAKCCGNLPFTSELVSQAIQRAKALDTGAIIADRPNTHVYKIMDELLSREFIEIRQAHDHQP
jgi:hypothetical protein